MKEKINTQKGFIPIILVIVIAVAIVSATVGIVKYKDEITANVSNVFKSKIETPDIESIAKEEPEIKKKQDDTQQLQEQLIIAEQKRLEAERQLIEEKAKQEAEKTKVEAEGSESVSQDSSFIKVEKCKILAETIAKAASSETYQEALYAYLEKINSSEPAVKDYYYLKSQLEMISFAQDLAKAEAERKYQSVYNSQYFECIDSDY